MLWSMFPVSEGEWLSESRRGEHKSVLAVMGWMFVSLQLHVEVTLYPIWLYVEIGPIRSHKGEVRSSGWDLIYLQDWCPHKKRRKTRDLPSLKHWGVATWGHSQKAAVYKPEREFSLETEFLAPWSWIPNLQNCEDKFVKSPVCSPGGPSWLPQVCIDQNRPYRPKVSCFCLISPSFLNSLKMKAGAIDVIGADIEHSPGNVSGLSVL